MSWQSPHMPKQLTRFKGYFGRSFDNADLRCGDVRSIGKRTTVSHRSSTSRWARRIHPVPHTFPAYGRTCTGYSQSTLAFMCRRLHYYTAEAWPSLGFGNTAAVCARDSASSLVKERMSGGALEQMRRSLTTCTCALSASACHFSTASRLETEFSLNGTGGWIVWRRAARRASSSRLS